MLKAVPRGPAVSGERQSLAPWRRHRGRQREMPRDEGRGGGFGDSMFYPLVNIQKTMENPYFSWENPL